MHISSQCSHFRQAIIKQPLQKNSLSLSLSLSLSVCLIILTATFPGGPRVHQ